MPIIHMLVGIPGSGKSTFSKKLSLQNKIDIISSDEVRNMHPDWEEIKIFPEVYRLIAEHIKNGKDCIYDATNPTPNVRHRLFDRLKEYNLEYDVVVHFFPTPYEVCYRRISIRNTLPGERYFPLDKLKGYAETIVEPTESEGFIKVYKYNYKD